MKKAFSLVVSALLIAALALPASAASPVSGEAAAILPIDVTLDQEALEIRKVYELPPSADATHLPKTISDGGRTMTLQNVEWQTDNTYNADDYEIGDRFTAICTYSGSQTSSYVKGYTTTAEYAGEVHRLGTSAIRYTVIFNGAPIPPEDPPSKLPGAAVMIPAGLAVLAAGGGGVYFWMKRKERRDYEAHLDGGSD